MDSPRKVIVGLVICIVLALVVSGRPARAQTIYVYSNCNNKLIRAYDGPNGYVYWGKPTALLAALPPGAWTANPLPNVGKATLVSLERCRVTVRDNDGLLYLDFDGVGWSFPTLPYRTWLPLMQKS